MSSLFLMVTITDRRSTDAFCGCMSSAAWM